MGLHGGEKGEGLQGFCSEAPNTFCSWAVMMAVCAYESPKEHFSAVSIFNGERYGLCIVFQFSKIHL